MSKTRRVVEGLRYRIEQGEFPDGRLPTVPELRAAYDVSITTLDKALAELQSAGVITRRHGAGIFVRQRVVYERRLVGDVFAEHDLVLAGEVDEAGLFERMTGATQDVHVDTDYRLVPAPPRVAGLLSVAPGTIVLERSWIYTTDGQPYQLARSYLPMEVAQAAGLVDPGSERKGIGTLWQLIRDGGVPVRYVHRRIEGRMPTSDELTRLAVPPGTPVFDRWGAMRRGDGTPVEAGVTTIPADQVSFVVDIDLETRTAT